MRMDTYFIVLATVRIRLSINQSIDQSINSVCGFVVQFFLCRQIWQPGGSVFRIPQFRQKLESDINSPAMENLCWITSRNYFIIVGRFCLIYCLIFLHFTVLWRVSLDWSIDWLIDWLIWLIYWTFTGHFIALLYANNLEDGSFRRIFPSRTASRIPPCYPGQHLCGPICTDKVASGPTRSILLRTWRRRKALHYVQWIFRRILEIRRYSHVLFRGKHQGPPIRLFRRGRLENQVNPSSVVGWLIVRLIDCVMSEWIDWSIDWLIDWLEILICIR